MLFHLFHALRDTIPGANVFRYVSTRIGLATLTSLLITFVVAPWFIRRARERQLGEVIRDDGPAGHASKRGTPTMGGALIILALVAATVLWCDLRSTLVWLALLVTVGYGAIGFGDDFLKLTKRNTKGLPGRFKLLAQFVIGIIATAIVIWVQEEPLSTGLAVPFFKEVLIPLGWFFLPFGMLVMMGASNAVNLTDGLDGLAIVPVMMAAATLGFIAYLAGNANFADYLQLHHVVGAVTHPRAGDANEAAVVVGDEAGERRFVPAPQRSDELPIVGHDADRRSTPRYLTASRSTTRVSC